jgi:hypothetical protein
MRWAGSLSDAHRRKMVDIVNEFADMHAEVLAELG